MSRTTSPCLFLSPPFPPSPLSLPPPLLLLLVFLPHFLFKKSMQDKRRALQSGAVAHPLPWRRGPSARLRPTRGSSLGPMSGCAEAGRAASFGSALFLSWRNLSLGSFCSCCSGPGPRRQASLFPMHRCWSTRT